MSLGKRFFRICEGCGTTSPQYCATSAKASQDARRVGWEKLPRIYGGRVRDGRGVVRGDFCRRCAPAQRDKIEAARTGSLMETDHD